MLRNLFLIYLIYPETGQSKVALRLFKILFSREFYGLHGWFSVCRLNTILDVCLKNCRTNLILVLVGQLKIPISHGAQSEIDQMSQNGPFYQGRRIQLFSVR
jgi:hypothetical protein